MIDKNLLIQLGWSEDLINEVTRISKGIDSTIKEPNGIEEPAVSFGSDSGNSIYFKSGEIDTGIHIWLC